MKPNLYIALVHYPVLNKKAELVTTSVTNFDLHDLARTSKTFGVSGCFIIHPSPAQESMTLFIKNYWREGFGAQYNPDRRDAFEVLEHQKTLEETYLTIKNKHGTYPKLVGTSAQKKENSLSFNELRETLQHDETPYLVLFGTGWGLAPSVIEQMDLMLEPIKGPVDYNHLPVRSAVAIVLDRLLGI